MSYPYSKYRDGADAEAHIRDFLTTWEINHAAQWLSTAVEDKSKIAEFVLSLDGPLANWFAQNGIRAFESFEQLTTKFTQLFHRQIPQKDLIGQFYAAYQEPNETVSQFVIRFQSLQLQIAKKIPDVELKDIFLEAIQEPLRTTLAVFDFSDQTIDKVIDKALAMDRTHKSKATINMTNLTNNLPSLEELRFRQAVQCTTCLNTGHSTVECSLRTHCTICHSKAHSVDQCEYNLLNKTTTAVRQIQSYQDNSRSRHEERYDNRYQTDRRNQRYQNDRNNYRQDDREDQRQDIDNRNFSPERDNNNR